MTNFEKIVSKLTVEKVAEFMEEWFCGCNGCPLEMNGSCDYHKHCEDNLKDWLKKEADE